MTDRARIEAKREAAARARRLAWAMGAPDDCQRLLDFAAELEAQITALERNPADGGGGGQLALPIRGVAGRDLVGEDNGLHPK